MAQLQNSKSDTLIVGAGCFGLSTALHLLRENPSSRVILLDRSPVFPSFDGASNDTSRIVRADYVSSLYARIAAEAMHSWKKDQTFASAFHQTGWIFAARPGNKMVRQSFETLLEMGWNEKGMEWLGTEDNGMGEEVRRRWKGLQGEMEGWNGYWNPEAGWANPRIALENAMQEFIRLGGTFASGPDGTMSSLIMSSEDPSMVIGVASESGIEYLASRVLLCTGARTPALVDTGYQLHPTGFCIAHWRLTAEEMEVWKDHPVVDLHRNGYFFPPDPVTRVMKMGIGIKGYGNHKDQSSKQGLSRQPDPGDFPDGVIPKEMEIGIRGLLSESAPGLANKEFFDMKVCWDAMNPVSSYLISSHPTISNLYLATGGSGHAFKMFPVIGKYVVQLLQGTLEPELFELWRWKEPNEYGEHWDDPSFVIGNREVRELGDDLDKPSYPTNEDSAISKGGGMDQDRYGAWVRGIMVMSMLGSLCLALKARL